MFPPKKHINRGIAINCPPVSSNLAGKSATVWRFRSLGKASANWGYVSWLGNKLLINS